MSFSMSTTNLNAALLRPKTIAGKRGKAFKCDLEKGNTFEWATHVLDIVRPQGVASHSTLTLTKGQLNTIIHIMESMQKLAHKRTLDKVDELVNATDACKTAIKDAGQVIVENVTKGILENFPRTHTSADTYSEVSKRNANLVIPEPVMVTLRQDPADDRDLRQNEWKETLNNQIQQSAVEALKQVRVIGVKLLPSRHFTITVRDNNEAKLAIEHLESWAKGTSVVSHSDDIVKERKVIIHDVPRHYALRDVRREMQGVLGTDMVECSWVKSKAQHVRNGSLIVTMKIRVEDANSLDPAQGSVYAFNKVCRIAPYIHNFKKRKSLKTISKKANRNLFPSPQSTSSTDNMALQKLHHIEPGLLGVNQSMPRSNTEDNNSVVTQSNPLGISVSDELSLSPNEEETFRTPQSSPEIKNTEVSPTLKRVTRSLLSGHVNLRKTVLLNNLRSLGGTPPHSPPLVRPTSRSC